MRGIKRINSIRTIFICAIFTIMALSLAGCGGGSGGSADVGITGLTEIGVPVRSAGVPTGILAAGTTSTAMSLTTDITATCRYSATPGVSYASMTNTFGGTGQTSHSITLTGLTAGSTYNYYVRCANLSGKANTDDYPISFSVASGGGGPQRSGGAPTGILPYTDTQTTMSLTTDVAATCRYSTAPGVSYASMTNTFTTTGFTSHSTTLTGLTAGTSYSYYIKCQDLSSNSNTDDYPISFSVASAPGAVLPLRSGGAPTGVLPMLTTQTTMSLTTDIDATCRYSPTAGVSYASMTNTFTTTGFTSHSTTITGLTGGTSYNYYVRCESTVGNANTDDYAISFSVASNNSYYSDIVNGSDSNNGSISSPWQHMEYGMQQLNPGDTLYLRQGTYSDTFSGNGSNGYLDVWSSNGDDGAPGAFKTVKNYPGETATVAATLFLSANYWRVEGLTFSSKPITVANEQIRIAQSNWANLTGMADWVHDIQIVGNTFIGMYRFSAVETWASNLLLENNILSNIQSDPNSPYSTVGLYVGSGDNLVIRGNIVEGQNGFGIHVFDERRQSGETYERVISNVLIENNLIYNAVGGPSKGILVSAWDGNLHTTGQNAIIRNNVVYNVTYAGILIGSGFNGVKVYNNTLYNLNSTGITLRAFTGYTSSTNVEIKNNIIDLGANYASNYHMDFNHSTGIITTANNLYWPGPVKFFNGASDSSPVVAAPSYVNAATYDLHLQAGSGATDTGLSLTVDVPTDMDGVARPLGAGYDIGAYESH